MPTKIDKTDKDLDCLSRALNDVTISSKTPEKQINRRSEVLESYLPSLILVRDFGLYAFSPEGNDKILKDVTKKDIDNILCTPDPLELPETGKLCERIKLPVPFMDKSKHLFAKHKPGFPCSSSCIISTYVALKLLKKESLDLRKESVKFVFGGSALNFLQEQKVVDPVDRIIVQKHGNVTFMMKYGDYVKDFGDIGFQFEQYVCKGTIETQAEDQVLENLQIIEICGHRIIVSAEVDAVERTCEADGKVETSNVEIKSGRKHFWTLKLPFQMVCNGSLKLIHGEKSRERTRRECSLPSILSVSSFTLENVCAAFDKHAWSAANKRMCESVKMLAKLHLKEGERYDLSFNLSRKLVVNPVKNEPKVEILPSLKATREIVGF